MPAASGRGIDVEDDVAEQVADIDASLQRIVALRVVRCGRRTEDPGCILGVLTISDDPIPELVRLVSDDLVAGVRAGTERDVGAGRRRSKTRA